MSTWHYTGLHTTCLTNYLTLKLTLLTVFTVNCHMTAVGYIQCWLSITVNEQWVTDNGDVWPWGHQWLMHCQWRILTVNNCQWLKHYQWWVLTVNNCQWLTAVGYIHSWCLALTATDADSQWLSMTDSSWLQTLMTSGIDSDCQLLTAVGYIPWWCLGPEVLTATDADCQ